MRSLLGGSRALPRRRLFLEPLEGRQLLSAGVSPYPVLSTPAPMSSAALTAAASQQAVPQSTHSSGTAAQGTPNTNTQDPDDAQYPSGSTGTTVPGSGSG